MDELLTFTTAGGIALSVDLTLSGAANSDGSYTVTGLAANSSSNYYGATTITGLAPVNTDGSDDKIFLNSALNNGGLVDLGGITFTTGGSPGGASLAGSSPGTNSGDINLFYTGSTTLLGNESFTADSYAIDTAPAATYLTLDSAIDPPCFLQGTLIRTPEGDREVENS